MRVPFRYESAQGHIDVVEDNLGIVMSVRAQFKRQGHGTGLMYLITRWADENNCVLLLHAQVFERNGIPNNDQLRYFYERFGFVRQEEIKRRIKMIRYPSQELHGP